MVKISKNKHITRKGVVKKNPRKKSRPKQRGGRMKVKMKKIIEKDEKFILPMYFKGNDGDEYVELDVESIYDELNQQIRMLMDVK